MTTCLVRTRAIGIIAATGCIVLAMMATPAWADGTVTGNCWIEKIKGRPGDYLELYEWNVYLSANNNTSPGQQFRVGLPPNPRAYYTFTSPGGTYSLFLDQPLFWGRPTARPSVIIPASGTTNVNVQLPTDYSCAFGDKSDPWGSDPWTAWEDIWHQTFIATGTSITGISFKLAGSNATEMEVSIRQDNGGAIATWPQVGVLRTKQDVGTGGDQWLRYRSGEIPTAPGVRYALKLEGMDGGQNSAFAVYRRDDNNDGYALGQAFDQNGAAQGFDLYAMVFSDNDETVVPYCARVYDAGNNGGWEWKWSQEIKAVGTSLAGATIYFASDTWDVPLNFRVHSGSVTGPQVGPTKTGRGAYQAANAGIAGVSWNVDEVPLTPGTIYYLEVSGTGGAGGSDGLNAAVFADSENAYPYGDAFKYESRQTGIDLHMQVVEYADSTPPTIWRSPSSFVRTTRRGTGLNNSLLSIRNTGGNTLSYTLSDNAEWLSTTPTSGYSTGETDPITVMYDVANLDIGNYNATITIDGPGATNTPRTVAVSVTIDPPLFALCDYDYDHDVDLDDFGDFQACVSGSGIPITNPLCIKADLDGDEDVDQNDYTKFANCLADSGPNVQVDTLCAD